jgi:ATP-dependent RNA helicase RhlE
MTSFKDLNLTKQILNALNDIGYTVPTPIQEKSFPIIMSGRDAVGIAQTGTGKTFSYLLPILRQLTFSEQKQPRVLIIVPTRELVVQVVEEIKKLTTYMSIRTVGIYGGGNINTQKQQVYDGVDILVGTPGRMIDLTHSRTLQFKNIQKLVIDEVDEMLNLGFRAQLTQLLDMLPEKRQNLMFSATLNEDVEILIEKHFKSPEYIELISRGTPLEKIIQSAYHIPNFYTKVNLLEYFLQTDKDFSKVLLFVKNKKIADDIFEELKFEFEKEIGVIHSNKSQPQRFSAVKKFDEGEHRLLIATDIVARGLDLKDVSHVVNFDMPLKDSNAYVHRIGRTGRADKNGIAISFITKKDAVIVKEIEQLMKKKIQIIEIPELVEISDNLTQDEKPVTRTKATGKIIQVSAHSGAAFHEKKEKNKKVNLGGKRRQENKRRISEKRNRLKSSGK